MNRRVTLMVSGILALGLAACNVKKEDESYSYTYEYNGCSTEKQEFSSLEDMCRGLRDDARNKYCAAELRAEAYQRSCGGGVGFIGEEEIALEEGDF